MKKALFISLVAVFVLAFATAAFAVAPSVIDPATGASVWSYQDLQDASAKYEGGYASFDDTTTLMYDNPHGGYNTTTNKCKVCHAVHRAEGAYYLLRADSQDDACSYCHIGSAHSTKVVYDLNPDGIYTMNGHTIGAQTQIPDSTVLQTAEAVVLSTTDANGDPLTETIHVRSYSTEKNKMYRFARHHGQSTASYAGNPDALTSPITGGARGGYQKIGPLALRCMSCHQPHNAVNEVWRPRVFTNYTATTYSTAVDGDFSATGYKLLRRSPAGTTIGLPSFTSASDPTEYYGYSQLVKAIEDSATPGVNFSQSVSGENTYTENGVVRSQPLWIAQDIHAAGSGDDTGIYRYPNKVNTMAVSWWCADCHNLNIGGWEPLTDPELGFKAHTERTHPAPFYGAYEGPAQCYTCHRSNLAPQMGLAAASDPTSSTIGGASRVSAYTSSRNSCSQCHYGTSDYYQERELSTYAEALDFPHSGQTTDIKLLGSYNITNTSTTGGWTPQYNGATVTATTLDQVCLRCHPGIGFNH